MPEEGTGREANSEPFVERAHEFVAETQELNGLDESELEDVLITIAMMLEDTWNRLIDQPVGSPNIISKISVTMHDEQERMIVVGGKRLEDDVELPIRWISDPETIRNLKKYLQPAGE